MASKPTAKAKAWAIFDRIVAEAAPGGVHTNPWAQAPSGDLSFEPDYATLERLLGVPLHLKANTQSGVPALALDVWLSYELRRAGFDPDRVWPRATAPRVLPAAISSLLAVLPKPAAKQLADKIAASSLPGVTKSSAKILGKNYLKQVDVIMTDWDTGPELLVSTKRMDSSYGKNAPNRVEESYGDAKNLRLRHPLAALGFVFGLRSDILRKEAATAEWLFDLLVKLGREDDAYHATCLILMEYDNALAPVDQGEPVEAGVPEPGLDAPEPDDVPAALPESELEGVLNQLPKVRIVHEHTPADLSPARFLAAMASRVLSATPVNMHREARQRRASPRQAVPST